MNYGGINVDRNQLGGVDREYRGSNTDQVDLGGELSEPTIVAVVIAWRTSVDPGSDTERLTAALASK